MSFFYIKMKEKGKKAWWFLTPNGDGTRLKIHASRVQPEHVDKLLEQLREENPELEFKSVMGGKI